MHKQQPADWIRIGSISIEGMRECDFDDDSPLNDSLNLNFQFLLSYDFAGGFIHLISLFMAIQPQCLN